MESLRLSSLSNLLRFAGDQRNSIVKDASVLSCGCLVSESLFLQLSTEICPVCAAQSVVLLKEVAPLRELYKIIQQVESENSTRLRRLLSLKQRISRTAADLKPHSAEELDLLGLFCKFAKEEANESQFEAADVKSISVKNSALKEPLSSSPYDQPIAQFSHSGIERLAINPVFNTENIEKDFETKLLLGLSEQEEYNFSQCFPFHRNVSTFTTQQNKFTFSANALKLRKFLCTSIYTTYDSASNMEIALFALVSDKRWELYKYSSLKPYLLACGKLSGEFGPLSGEMKSPRDEGIVVRNDFSGAKVESVEGDGLSSRLKSWIQLSCCLSGRYLIISGTKGLVRVLNVDPSYGAVGEPVYSYLTNFPIRCISLSPNDKLVACGITAREKISGKQQPFVILHQIETDLEGKVSVTPITITVPYRDPLKIINFNASSTHLLCCTVYEMRYFIIRLRGEDTTDYKRPRLIFSDMRVARKSKKRDSGEDRFTDLDEVFGGDDNDDDQMLDNEGITDIKFGRPYTNTMIITTSSIKNRPSLVLKLNGPAIDSRKTTADNYSEDMMFEFSLQTSHKAEDNYENTNIVDADVIMKIPEIGSTIYGVDVSPRGDGMVFVDKLGRLLLVSTSTQHFNVLNQGSVRKSVVQLGEVAPALRSTEAATAKFSAHGGKIFTVDRKGLIQVFDFTKGIPGEHPGVFKCKIISV